MRKTNLGQSGLSVCVAPFGAMFLGTKQNREESFALLDHYVAAGGDFLDTANIYAHWVGDNWRGGESEVLLGEWFRARRNRDSVIVASKVGFGYQDVPTALTPALIEAECNKSLKRMGIETIDLYFAHCDDLTQPQDEILAAFDKLKRQGKVRAIGASNFMTDRLATANLIAKTNGLHRYDVLQQRHTYLQPRRDADTGPQIVLTRDMEDYCRRADVSIMAYSVTLGGAYTGDAARPVPAQYDTAANKVRLAALQDIARETRASPQTVLLAWMWSRPGMLPLIASSSIQQLDDNLKGLTLALTNEQLKRLDLAEA